MKFILGQKIGMSQIFNEKNQVVPITLIEVGPCLVTQLKTEEKDGYESVQISFGQRKVRKNIKPRYLREFRLEKTDFKLGDQITADTFKEGDIVKVSGISKGKGFQGVVKRHGFRGGPASHGAKHVERAPGSIGSAFPERVWKGKKMAGRMGSDRVTVKNLKVVRVDKENNLLAIKGALPGRKGTLIEVRGQG